MSYTYDGIGIEWNFEEKPFKKVILCNAKDYEGIKPSEVWNSLQCMGKFEWEDYLSELLCEAIESAHGGETADITVMFSREMIGYWHGDGEEYRARHEHVVEFLKERLFDVVSETDDELRVNLKIEFKK